MDGGKIAAHFGASLASGLIITFAITAAVLPASFLMNRYIYHHWLMRMVIGAVGGIMGFGAFLIILGLVLSGKLEQAHYFGLYPLRGVPIADGTGWVLPGIIHTILKPIMELFEFQFDKPAYDAAVDQLMVKNSEAGVNENLFAEARAAAAMVPDKPAKGDQPADWTSYLRAMDRLQALLPPKSE